MEKYNENNASEMLTKLMDNELSAADKEKIINKIKSDDDLQSEKNAHEKIREAIKKDEDSFKPPIAATSAVFGSLGMKYPVEAAGASFLISTFFKKYGVALGVLALTIVTGLFFLPNEKTKANITEKGKTEISSEQIPTVSQSKIDEQKSDESIAKNNVSNENRKQQEINRDKDLNSFKHNTSENNNKLNNKIKNIIAGDIANKQKQTKSVSDNLENNKIATFHNPFENVQASRSMIDFSNFNGQKIQTAVFANTSYRKYNYYTDIHKESIFNVGFNGFNSQETGNNGLGVQLSLNLSRISPKFSGYLSQLRLSVLSENIQNSLGESDFGNSRAMLTARLNPEIEGINLLNTDLGRPILELGVGNFEVIQPVGAVGYEFRIFANTLLEAKYTHFGSGIISIGFSKGF